MKYFSMFSGIGGFELGIERATKSLGWIQQENKERQDSRSIEGKRNRSNEWECVGFSEIDKYAIQTYLKHFPDHKNYGDATKIIPRELPDFDMLCAGFPCQSFSIAGKRLGFEDTRGTLFFDIARIVKVKRPQYLFLENVKGLLNHDNGRTFTTILATLDELGYNAEWQVLNSKHFGVPQNRERVFIIGHLRGASGQQVFPIRESNDKTNNKMERKYYPETPCFSTIKAGYSHGMQNDWTIVKQVKFRRITPIECERLQGFPDNWTEGVSDTQRYKQLGNAVTVNVIEEIIKKWNQN